MVLPRILFISTGGTITMIPSQQGGINPALSGQDLVNRVPELAGVADIEVNNYCMKPGPSITLEDTLAIANIVNDAFAQGFTGAVVVQGTDTIEETAFVLDLLVKTDHPLVVTGAMRGATAPGADGAANLLSAAMVASAKAAQGLGTLVVLNDEVHAARYVQKCHTAHPSAFTSPGLGPVGWVIEGEFQLYMRPMRGALLLAPPSLQESAVALIKVVLGDDGRLLPALPALGYKGAVIEAMGAGHLPAQFSPLVHKLTQQMPVILATRVYAGPVFRRTYGFIGAEMDLIAQGAISGGMLSGNKACMLLRLLLAHGYQGKTLQQQYEKYS